MNVETMMPKNLVGRLVLFIVLFNGLFCAAHFFIVSQSLSDGTHINPHGANPWQSSGMKIVVIDSARNELRDGDVILAVEDRPIAAWMDRLYCLSPSCAEPTPPQLGQGTELTYTLLRDGEVLTARSALRPYPFWSAISGSWGGLTFTVITYLIFLVLLLKQPNESSILAMAMMAAGFLGASGWGFSLDPVDILYRHTFWLYQFGTFVCYFIGLGGLLHFTLVFPKPLPLISRYPRLLVLPYVGALGILWLVLLGYNLTTQNKLLWMAHSYEISPLIDAVWYGLAGLAIIQNYRSLNLESERRQVYLVVFSIALILLLALVLHTLPSILFGESLVSSDSIAVTALIIPIAIVISIRRYQLWAIDPIVNRALVYLSLSAIIIGLYIIIVVVTGSMLQTGMSLPVSIFATGVVAVLFQPLRDRLQRGVNRLLYGERDDPYAVLARLGQRLDATLAPDAVLPTIVQTVKEGLKLPYTAIALRQGDSFEIAASAGEPTHDALRLPLAYQGEAVGELVLGFRAPDEAFSSADRRLLDGLAHQAGVVVHAVRLTTDLQRARGRLVMAREEERRRIRNDLHDGLAPTLSSLQLQLGAVLTLIRANPDQAETLASEMREDLRHATSEIRRLVYDLRPPMLDELGLVSAIRSFRFQGSPVSLSVNAPDPMPNLPAAVEVAVYRVASEALHNVIKHAQATACIVGIEFGGGSLKLSVTDNGNSLPDHYNAGVGLRSMKERAAELGGTLSIHPCQSGGTQVVAQFPLDGG